MKENNYKNSLIKILTIGCFYFIVSSIALIKWVPDMKKMELTLLSDFFIGALAFMMLFSLFIIVFSLRVSVILKRENNLSQKYIQIIRICYVTFLIIFPLIIFINQSYMYSKMFNQV